MKRKIFAVFFSAAICLFSFSSCGSSESSPDIDIQGIKDDITEQDEAKENARESAEERKQEEARENREKINERRQKNIDSGKERRKAADQKLLESSDDSRTSDTQRSSSLPSGDDPAQNSSGSAGNTAMCQNCGKELRLVDCGYCSGSGTTGYSSCPRCNGDGKICQNCFYNLDGSGGGSVQNGSGVCSACNGTRTCHVCYGNTYTYIPSYTDTAGTYVYCSSCNGTNICEFCGGTGRE